MIFNYRTKKSEYSMSNEGKINYILEQRSDKPLYNSRRNFSGRCCKTVSSEPCLCNGEHCVRAL